MPVLSDPKREKFAQFCARGIPTTDAYERAGYRRNTGNAATFRKRPEIAKRIQELSEMYENKHQEELAEYIHNSGLSPTHIIKQIMEAADGAKEAKKFDIAIKGYKDVGQQLFGMFIEAPPPDLKEKNSADSAPKTALDVAGLNKALEGLIDKRPTKLEIDGIAERVESARAILPP